MTSNTSITESTTYNIEEQTISGEDHFKMSSFDDVEKQTPHQQNIIETTDATIDASLW